MQVNRKTLKDNMENDTVNVEEDVENKEEDALDIEEDVVSTEDYEEYPSSQINEWGITEIKYTKINYKWIVKNLSMYVKGSNDVLVSPIFPTNTDDDIRWTLQFYPENISLYLRLMTDGITVNTEFTFSVLNGKKQETLVAKRYRVFNKVEGYGVRNFADRNIIMDPANDLLINDDLTILCQIKIKSGEIKTLTRLSEKPDINICQMRLLHDYKKLFEDSKFSDIIIIVQEQKFPVHKNILASRSAVFSAMFEHDMKENKEKVVHIVDIDKEVMKEVLRFIYTGNVENSDQLAKELLVAAEKYQLEDLKEIAQVELCKNLTIENVSSFLVLADSNNADKLKKESLSFMIANIKDIVNIPDFKSIKYLKQDLLSQVLNLLAETDD